MPKQFDVIRAFAISSEAESRAVTSEEAGKIIGMAATTVNVALAFLSDSNILIRTEAGKYVPSEAAKAFQKAYEWKPETAGLKLAPLMEETWYGKCLLPKLKMRAWTKDEAIFTLADASNAAIEYRPNVAMILQFLTIAGLVRFDGETVHLMAKIDGPPENGGPPPPKPPSDGPPAVVHEGLIPDTIYLTKDRKRKVVVHYPSDLSGDEIGRITKWLNLACFVDEDSSQPPAK